VADFSADHWTGPSEGVLIKANESRFPPLLHVGITRDGVRADHTTISTSDAHKLADWIKENIPEPPPAPPEWRISRDATCALLEVLIDKENAHWPLMAYVRTSGEIVYPGGIPDGITPELHKEMICALLDAYYELHKGES